VNTAVLFCIISMNETYETRSGTDNLKSSNTFCIYFDDDDHLGSYRLRYC